MSYFSGGKVSAIESDSRYYPLWETDLCANGLQTEKNPNPQEARDRIGKEVMDRAAPSMLNRDTMFYAYSDWDTVQ